MHLIDKKLYIVQIQHNIRLQQICNMVRNMNLEKLIKESEKSSIDPAMSKKIELMHNVRTILKECNLPIVTREIKLHLKGAYETRQIRDVLDELVANQEAQKIEIESMKENLYLATKDEEIKYWQMMALEFEQMEGVTQYIGIGDLANVSTVAGVRQYGTEESGIQRAKEGTWVKLLANQFSLETTLMPTSVILYFEQEDITFTPFDFNEYLIQDRELEGVSKYQLGILEVPYNRYSLEEEKPGWILDGQQRIWAMQELGIQAALGGKKIKKLLAPISILSSKESSVEDLRVWFVNANEVKNLPKTLVQELAAKLSADHRKQLNPKRQEDAIRGKIVEGLNTHNQSPLNGQIRTQLNPKGDIAYRALVNQIKFMARTFDFLKEKIQIEEGIDEALELLIDYYIAISAVWPEAWMETRIRNEVASKNGKISYKSTKYNFRLLEPIGLGTFAILLDKLAPRDMPYKTRKERRLLILKELARISPYFTWRIEDFPEDYTSNTRESIEGFAEIVYSQWKEVAGYLPDEFIEKQAVARLTKLEEEMDLN